MKRILLVSYYYPPYQFGGALRFKRFFDELRNKKHEVVLLTSGERQEDDGESVVRIRDSFRRDNFSRGRNFLRSLNPLPDTMLSWSIRAAGFIERAYEKTDVIFVTAPPFSLPLILSLRHGGKYLSKFVLDTRDLLYGGTLRDYGMAYPKISDSVFERRIFKSFGRFTTNVDNHARVLKERYGIEVAFVANSFGSHKAKRVDLKRPAFVYAGKIDRVRFNPDLFEGFGIFSAKNEGFIYLAGEDREKLLSKHLSDRVIYLGIKSREDAEDLIYSSDACLMMHDYSIRDSASVLSYKITDYAKYVKPVLYVGPKSAAAEFIEKEFMGISVTVKDAEKISSAFSSILAYRASDAREKFRGDFTPLIHP